MVADGVFVALKVSGSTVADVSVEPPGRHGTKVPRRVFAAALASVRPFAAPDFTNLDGARAVEDDDDGAAGHAKSHSSMARPHVCVSDGVALDCSLETKTMQITILPN